MITDDILADFTVPDPHHWDPNATHRIQLRAPDAYQRRQGQLVIISHCTNGGSQWWSGVPMNRAAAEALRDALTEILR